MKKINIKGVNETLFHETLSNGLNIYLLPNKQVKNYYITFTTKFGSLDTEFKKNNEVSYTKVPNGIAHFLEHLTFKMEDGDASDYFPTIGCQANAYTSYKITSYEVFGYKNFKEALDYQLTYVQTPFYNEKNVSAEKGIICEEVKMRMDMPAVTLSNITNNALFKNDNRKYLITGKTTDVKSITLKDILACYNTFYHPSNMILVITGNFNPEEALAIIEENQSKKDFSKPIDIKRKKISEPKEIVKNEAIEECNVEIDKASVALKIPKSIFKSLNLREEELSIYISMIINSMFGRSSEIREKLVSGNIVTDGPYVSKYFTDEHLIITITAETPYKERFIKLIKEEIKNIDIFETDLIRKKRVSISNFILSFDDIEETNRIIVDDIILFGDYIYDVYDIYNSLNIETAKKVAKKLITDNITVAVITKKEK